MEVSIYRLRIRDVLTLCVLALLLLGIIMVQSASVGAADHAGWQWSPNAIKDAVFAGIGLALFLIAGSFNYAWLGQIPVNRWKTPILWILAITILANMLVL